MPTYRVWMTYTGVAEVDYEAEEGWEVPRKLNDFPGNLLADLDASLREISPDDWGGEEK